MTNEETIAYFKECNEKLISVAKDENVYDYEKQVIEADCMRRTFEANEKAIQALEKQPCEDCISRAEALKHSFPIYDDDGVGYIVIRADKIEQLPSVTPQQRVGRWILEEVKDEDGRPYDIKYFCSECQAERPPIWDDYCGACGAKMLQANSEEQEDDVVEMICKERLIDYAYKNIDVLDKIRAEIDDEAEYAYADFDKYKEDILYAEPDELPDDDFRYGLRRAVEIINKYKRGI